MLTSQTIKKALPHTLTGVSLEGYGKKFSGKVRDYYVTDGVRILITTDRQSAFDVNLGYIPYKGAVLNQLSAFWFTKTKQIVPNHMLAVPDPNVMIVRDCLPIPVEMVVRGYISGVTKTSIWYSYEKGERIIYRLRFPDGLRKNQKLPDPVITPTTHGSGKGGHDERLTRDEIIKQGIVSKKLYHQMEHASIALFKFGSNWAKKHGLILVDTKYEFGLYKGKLMLIDEIHTPDSSRFWKADTYAARFRAGLEPENFDKEFLRLWYVRHGYQGDGKPPVMPTHLAVALSKRYIAVYEKLTGMRFGFFPYPADARVAKSVSTYFRSAIPNSHESKPVKHLTYKQSGVDYDAFDKWKKKSQELGISTASNLHSFGAKELAASRGESAYIWEEKDGYRAFVIEGLGTKNLVADEMRERTGKSYYRELAQDTVAMIVNDMITLGALPEVVNAYFAVGDSVWFEDIKRITDLLLGWQHACKLAGAVWGGGETPVLKDVISRGAIDLAGSAIGIIRPKKNLLTGKKIRAGDAIICIESSGIHANGITLARTIAGRLPEGYRTKLPSGVSYGEALMTPTHIYVPLIRSLQKAGADLHYAVNVTGHGWRKLMRAREEFSYVIEKTPDAAEIFRFIQKHSGLSDAEMYGTFNMGVGFVLYAPPKECAKIIRIAKKNRLRAWVCGHIEKGEKAVRFTDCGITFSSQSLGIR